MRSLSQSCVRIRYKGDFMITFKLALPMFFVVCAHAIAQTSFWPASAIPGREATHDPKSVTLGLKFYSDVPGTITAVRFHKGWRNSGTHVGALWSNSGTRLATVTFSGETWSGWQQATFPSPVSIAANTTYVVSYSAPNGNYAYDSYYSWSSLSAGTLHVADGSPGVFAYGGGTIFPGSSWNRTNYWVDVVFKPAAPNPPPTPSTYSISGTVSGSGGAALTLSGPVSRSTTTTSGPYTFSSLPNGLYVVAASKSGYTFNPPTASVTINGRSITGVNFAGTAAPNPIPHTVSLRWNPSTSSNIRGYNVYRAAVAGGAFGKLNASPMSATSYVDSTVASGRTYYYVTTTVNTNNLESAYSNQAAAVVPSP